MQRVGHKQNRTGFVPTSGIRNLRIDVTITHVTVKIGNIGHIRRKGGQVTSGATPA